jgi:flagellin
MNFITSFIIESSSNTNYNINKSLEKLSSGLKINKASDDSSGLAISDKLRTQATSINQGIANGNTAISLTQIADKAMSEQSNILDTVKSKLIQSSTDTTSREGRDIIQTEIKKLLTQFDNIASQTNYNNQTLLEPANEFNFQLGENASDIITIKTSLASNTASLGGNNLYSNNDPLLPEGTITLKGATPSGSMFRSDFKNNNHLGSTISGSVSYFLSDLGMKLSPNDTDTKAIFDQAVVDGDAVVNNGIYTFHNPLTFSPEENISMTVELSNVNIGNILFISTSGVTFTNASADTNITFLNTMSVGGSLNFVKNNSSLTDAKAKSYLDIIDKSLDQLNSIRSTFGSGQNQIESSVRNLITQVTNIKNAESIIRDVDYAIESSNFNKQNIISQAGSYALSQANKMEQNIIEFLK